MIGRGSEEAGSEKEYDHEGKKRGYIRRRLTYRGRSAAELFTRRRRCAFI
jgi:hypothetical protein